MAGPFDLLNMNIELKGVSQALLSSGAAGVTGNLWTVTDKDEDLVTKALIRKQVMGEKDLGYSWRERLTLKVLNGDALVCYGFPEL